VHFKEGEFVKAGQLLFTLDARTDEANTAKARAQQAKDAASLSDAQRQLARAKQLLAQNFVSQGAVETAQALVDTAAATVAADKAAVDASQVALSYARIVAPNSGRAGQVTVFAGSAVQASLTPLVTITQLDPIGVVFSIPQRNLNDALEALKAGGAAVNATLADGGGRFKGRLKFVDNLVDPNSGAVKVKAVFDNPKNLLWPGVFVDVLQTVSTLKDAVVIPQRAKLCFDRSNSFTLKVAMRRSQASRQASRWCKKARKTCAPMPMCWNAHASPAGLPLVQKNLPNHELFRALCPPSGDDGAAEPGHGAGWIHCLQKYPGGRSAQL
jgi:RND family efflux transporter MFP subunit